MRRCLSPCRPSFAVEEGSGEKMELRADLGALELVRVTRDGARNESIGELDLPFLFL